MEPKNTPTDCPKGKFNVPKHLGFQVRTAKFDVAVTPPPSSAAAEFGDLFKRAFQSDQGVRDQGRCFREDPGRENPKLRENPRN